MADAGWIPAYRSTFEPEHWLAPTKRDPASRRDAWFDLCQMATWQPRETYQSGIIARGEFVASLRTLGERWKWDHLKVRRFLIVLQERRSVATVRETPDGTVYRVVNYDTYAVGENTERNTERNSNETAVKQEQEVKHSRRTDSAPRKHRLPDGWKPSDSHRRKADSEGVDLAREEEKFRDHAVANGRTQLDWDRAFNTWLMRAAEFGARPNGNGRAPSVANPMARGRL